MKHGEDVEKDLAELEVLLDRAIGLVPAEVSRCEVPPTRNSSDVAVVAYAILVALRAMTRAGAEILAKDKA